MMMIETPPLSNSEPEDMGGLRCNRCNKPITAAEAILTPTGYRCRDCVRQQQKVFDNTKGADLVIGFVVSGILAFAGSWLANRVSYLVFLIAPGIGLLIYNSVRFLLKRRRSRALSKAILAGAITGVLPLLVIALINVFSSSGTGIPNSYNLLSLFWQAAYTAIVPSSAYLQAKGG
jgi:hypothetical protein